MAVPTIFINPFLRSLQWQKMWDASCVFLKGLDPFKQVQTVFIMLWQDLFSDTGIVIQGSTWQSSLKRQERTIVNQTKTGTVSKATLGKLLRDGVEHIIFMGFSECIDTILNWTELVILNVLECNGWCSFGHGKLLFKLYLITISFTYFCMCQYLWPWNIL